MQLRGIPQLVRHDIGCLLIGAGDVDSLAEALPRLGGNASLRNRTSDSSRERIEMGSSKARAIPVLGCLYEFLIERGGT